MASFWSGADNRPVGAASDDGAVVNVPPSCSLGHLYREAPADRGLTVALRRQSAFTVALRASGGDAVLRS
jgi:hypothetical protein